MKNSCALAFGIMAAAAPMIAGSAQAQSLDGPYRGMYVCEKLKISPDILRAPIDLVVSGASVRFGRPLFNWSGTRVTGTELGDGTIEGSKIHLTRCRHDRRRAGSASAFAVWPVPRLRAD